MVNGWAPDGAVQDQIDDTIKDAIQRARTMMPAGESAEYCDDFGEDILERRRQALPGTRTYVACQSKRGATIRSVGVNRRGSKDSQLRYAIAELSPACRS
jgi:RNA polymerase-binding transcription factor DksA